MNASGEITDRAFARILGQEVRQAREAVGLTRLQIVHRLPSGIGDRALLSYEHGTRHMTVVRLVEISRELDVTASEILRKASMKARDFRNYAIDVNLRSVLQDEQKGFEPIRTWAQNRLNGNPNHEVLLAPATLAELATAFGFSHDALAAYLIEFTSDDLATEIANDGVDE